VNKTTDSAHKFSGCKGKAKVRSRTGAEGPEERVEV